MKVEEAVLGSPSLTVLMVTVDVKQHNLNVENQVPSFPGAASERIPMLAKANFHGRPALSLSVLLSSR